MLKGFYMTRLNHYLILVIWVSIVIGIPIQAETMHFDSKSYAGAIMAEKPSSGATDLKKLNNSFYASIAGGDTARSRSLLKQIFVKVDKSGNDSLTVSDSHYYAGIYFLLREKFTESEKHLRKASEIRERLVVFDTTYAKTFYNLGVIYSSLGDYSRMEQSVLRSVEIEKQLFGESSPELAEGYSSLSTAYLGMKEYDRAIGYGNTALKIIAGRENLYPETLAELYTNLGVCYIKLSDYSKAVLYLEKGEAVFKEYSLMSDDRYLNMLNSLAAAYFYLGEQEKSDKYYEMGIDIADTGNTFLSQNFVNSFAKIVGNSGNIEKGESIMLYSLKKAETRYGHGSWIYTYVLKNYADYLREFRIDAKRSLLLYEECMKYLEMNTEDNSLNGQIRLGYALALSENDNPLKALGLIQDLINSELPGEIKGAENSGAAMIKADQWSLSLLRARYDILWNLFRRSHELKYLLEAAETSSLIVAIIDKVRLIIDEEESRLILGDRYRDYYIFAIRDCDICYRATGEEHYIDKAFELSERSKAAALLTATRELKATQFHIPSKIAEEEKRLQKIISFYGARISEESAREKPDSCMIAEWKDIVFNSIRKRDSLVTVFERDYPGYYMIKYNNRIINPNEIHASAGRNINYINYVAGDTVLYILVANRKTHRLITVSIGKGFYSDLRHFSDLIKFPSMKNARSDYERFQNLGSSIYDNIFRPVEPYLISDRLLISPDNILAYIPFEAIPMHKVYTGRISYRDLPYMIKKFNISYAYSATFLSESKRSGANYSKDLIAFAPYYGGTLNADSIMQTRQHNYSVLNDLPYARKEAEFASRYFGGRLYAGDEAKESLFKSEAGKYDIIHLAMHTVINDDDPMHSKMVFSQVPDKEEDGLLNTWEVYGLPLKAKMAILSSCNTGTGMLHSGEGILSLARGFMYSGCESVVMSLWEVEDMSGSDLISSFYRSLKKGTSKSSSLRSARLEYIKKADMLKSHPHFWSSLVIYGNNGALCNDRNLMLISAIAFVIAGFLVWIFYFRSR
ncbi:MAG: CHAT domain-containing protein [Bacteroidales bacterium]|nr:CHAT domain-containing protein [Bacteroidales bacterium]